MKRRSILGIAGALVATMAITGSAFAATLFDNGSFETGPSGTTTLTGGQTDITGWTVTGTDIDYVADMNPWHAADGSKSLDLNGFGQGGIEQTFTTKLNAIYVVEFALSGNPGTHEQYPNGDASPSTKTLTVHATGGATTPFSFDTTANGGNTFADMKWVPSAYSFKATGTETTLSFASTTAGAFGPAIDNVRVTESLLTGADCKKGGWQAMVDLNGNHFRNQGDCVSYYATGEKNLAN